MNKWPEKFDRDNPQRLYLPRNQGKAREDDLDDVLPVEIEMPPKEEALLSAETRSQIMRILRTMIYAAIGAGVSWQTGCTKALLVPVLRILKP